MVVNEREKTSDIISVMSPERVGITEQLFDELTPVMNEIHDMNHSRRFWLMVIEEHVRSMVSRKHLLDKKPVDIGPDFYPINQFSFPSLKERLRARAVGIAKHFLNRKDKQKIQKRLSDNDEIGIGFPDLPELTEQEVGVEIPEYYPLMIGFGDRSKRSKVNAIAQRYDDPFLVNVIRQLPRIMIEHFQDLYDDIDLVHPKDKLFRIHGLMLLGYRQLLIAKYVEHGAGLIWYQHGAGYGEIALKYSRFLEYSVADKYITWGWKLAENDVPGKAYRMEKFKRNFDQHQQEKMYDILLTFPAMDGSKKRQIVSETHELLAGLDNQLYQNILARPRPPHQKHSHASELDFITDDHVTITSGLESMLKEMTSARLILQMEVPCTNFLECIYVDYPTIGLLKNPEPTEILKPYYAFFKEVGILHEDVQSLVTHLNNINIEEWWQDITRQPEYQSFKDTFVRKV